jgi:hypothetical protein
MRSEGTREGKYHAWLNSFFFTKARTGRLRHAQLKLKENSHSNTLKPHSEEPAFKERVRTQVINKNRHGIRAPEGGRSPREKEKVEEQWNRFGINLASVFF